MERFSTKAQYLLIDCHFNQCQSTSTGVIYFIGLEEGNR